MSAWEPNRLLRTIQRGRRAVSCSAARRETRKTEVSFLEWFNMKPRGLITSVCVCVCVCSSSSIFLSFLPSDRRRRRRRRKTKCSANRLTCDCYLAPQTRWCNLSFNALGPFSPHPASQTQLIHIFLGFFFFLRGGTFLKKKKNLLRKGFNTLNSKNLVQCGTKN